MIRQLGLMLTMLHCGTLLLDLEMNASVLQHPDFKLAAERIRSMEISPSFDYTEDQKHINAAQKRNRSLAEFINKYNGKNFGRAKQSLLKAARVVLGVSEINILRAKAKKDQEKAGLSQKIGELLTLMQTYPYKTYVQVTRYTNCPKNIYDELMQEYDHFSKTS